MQPFDSHLLEEILNPGAVLVANYEGTAIPPDHTSATYRLAAVNDMAVGRNGWGTTATLEKVSPPSGSGMYGTVKLGAGTEADWATGSGVWTPGKSWRHGDGYGIVVDTVIITPDEAIDFKNFALFSGVQGAAAQIGLTCGYTGPGTTNPAAWKEYWVYSAQDITDIFAPTTVKVLPATKYRLTTIIAPDGTIGYFYINGQPVGSVNPMLYGFTNKVLYDGTWITQAASSGMVNHKMTLDYHRCYRIGTPADAAKGAVTMLLPNNTTRLDHYDT